jgi:CPA2 family monovalent cation:H+ antiporter-2
MEIAWVSLDGASSFASKTLIEANIRAQTGVSVIAILRNQQLIANPKSATVLQAGDIIGLIGETAQIGEARRLLSPETVPVVAE